MCFWFLGQPHLDGNEQRWICRKKFAEVHPKYKTLVLLLFVTGFIGRCSCTFPQIWLQWLTFCSIGTLFAFVLVCAGSSDAGRKTKMSKGKIPDTPLQRKNLHASLAALAVQFYLGTARNWLSSFVGNDLRSSRSELITDLNQGQLETFKNGLLTSWFRGHEQKRMTSFQKYRKRCLKQIRAAPEISNWSLDTIQKSGWQLFKHKIPMWIFIFTFALMTLLSVSTGFPIMIPRPPAYWVACTWWHRFLWKTGLVFTVWLIIGLIIYFSYSIRNSKLNRVSAWSVSKHKACRQSNLNTSAGLMGLRFAIVRSEGEDRWWAYPYCLWWRSPRLLSLWVPVFLSRAELCLYMDTRLKSCWMEILYDHFPVSSQIAVRFCQYRFDEEFAGAIISTPRWSLSGPYLAPWGPLSGGKT